MKNLAKSFLHHTPKYLIHVLCDVINDVKKDLAHFFKDTASASSFRYAPLGELGMGIKLYIYFKLNIFINKMFVFVSKY